MAAIVSLPARPGLLISGGAHPGSDKINRHAPGTPPGGRTCRPVRLRTVTETRTHRHAGLRFGEQPVTGCGGPG
jgi:hypothetical protein